MGDPDKEKMKILVVDDEEIMRNSLRDILGDEGYTVKTVETGDEAIAFIREEYFNLVIADIKMPNVSGIDVLKAVKQNDFNGL